MKPLGRLYIRPQWVGWTGEAKMAYVITATDYFDAEPGRESWIVEFSASKPAMENKWTFREPGPSQFIRRSFYEFLHERKGDA